MLLQPPPLSHHPLPPREYQLADVKARFSEMVQKAMLGETVIVTKENRPVVKIVAIKPAKRKPGTGKGIQMAADFDAPLEDFAEYQPESR